MATINKDFKIKQGLIVEGATATVNGLDILTKKQADQDYIVGLIGGAAVSTNTANTIVERDADGNFAAGTITATLTGNVTGNLTGDVTGQVSSLANHDTADLAEHASNKYFTDARALTATAAAYDVAGAAAAAQTAATNAAAADATTKANAAQSAAISTASADATSKANAAQSAAEATASSDATTKVAAEAALRVSGDAASVSTASADATAKVAAEAALRVSGDSATLASAAADATSKADAAQAAAATYTDNSVAALVDGAPALLNTLNELAAAISDDDNFATTLTTSVGTKVSKDGDTMTGLLVLSADPAANLGAATKQYVDTAEADAVSTASADATSKANAAQSAAEATASSDATTKVAAEAALRVSGDSATLASAAADATSKADAAQAAAATYTDGEITDALVTAQGYASTAQGNAETHTTNAINAIDTDDIEEGATNLYFTDVRAKSSAADLLTGATKTNITITGNGAGLVITAENGVADSTTSDLAEGTNLYFTNARARSAVDGTTRSFTAVEINSVAKEVAATATIVTAGTETALSWAKADYKTAKALVKFATATHTEVSEILLTIDSSDNVAITEYAEIATNGAMGTVTATVVGGDVRINVTTLNNNTTVVVKATLLA